MTLPPHKDGEREYFDFNRFNFYRFFLVSCSRRAVAKYAVDLRNVGYRTNARPTAWRAAVPASSSTAR